ncbi:hypothetical protein N7537_010714 [Penicillium hordei]|uniref:Uncharacterized protein n=1 Tax=Penicillium hordei TaxID=40994 RepID=A0AAD6DKT2_9EURO|nr:uncharacterized protein N7537_010714 [Penicillium hordei]KAJ5588036.1 hypothetical protein N7537_010714 [Penicillium hordei]
MYQHLESITPENSCRVVESGQGSVWNLRVLIAVEGIYPVEGIYLWHIKSANPWNTFWEMICCLLGRYLLVPRLGLCLIVYGIGLVMGVKLSAFNQLWK